MQPRRCLQRWGFVAPQSDNFAPFSSSSSAADLIDRRFDPSPTHSAADSFLSLLWLLWPSLATTIGTSKTKVLEFPFTPES